MAGALSPSAIRASVSRSRALISGRSRGVRRRISSATGLELRRHHGAAARHRRDGVAELARVRVLREVPGRAAGESRVHLMRLGPRREHHHARAEPVAIDRVQNLLAGQPAQRAAYQRYVGALRRDRVERRPPVARLAHQLELGPPSDRARKRVAVEGLVVRREDAYAPSWLCTKSLTQQDS
jgi:hypothetical protein